MLWPFVFACLGVFYVLLDLWVALRFFFFCALSLLWQTLMDAEKREIYNKLGPEAAASKAPMNENTMLLEVQYADKKILL